MRPFHLKCLFTFVCFFSASLCFGQAQSPAASTPAPADATIQANNTTAAAAIASGAVPPPHTPQLLEVVTDKILGLFDVRTSGNTSLRWGIAAGIFVVAVLIRRIVVTLVFAVLRKIASKTKSTLDDKLFDRTEAPAAAYVIVLGIVCALSVLKFDATTDEAIGYASTIGFSLVTFWLLLRAFTAVIDHVQEIAVARKSPIAAFMPWIKKTLVVIFMIVGVLMIAQSLGANVKAFLAGLGIGGLAFALAAQDTIANLFGSVVVAMDQPLKIGDVVQIGANTGSVEDIGLRSTKIRRADRSLLIIPNKTVAAETIINFSRINIRRNEQVINLPPDTPPDKVKQIIESVRSVVRADPLIEPSSVLVTFNGSSLITLDVLLVYMAKNADLAEFLKVRERINLAIMAVVAVKGVIFTFPTQTIQYGGETVQKSA